MQKKLRPPSPFFDGFPDFFARRWRGAKQAATHPFRSEWRIANISLPRRQNGLYYKRMAPRGDLGKPAMTGIRRNESGVLFPGNAIANSMYDEPFSSLPIRCFLSAASPSRLAGVPLDRHSSTLSFDKSVAIASIVYEIKRLSVYRLHVSSKTRHWPTKTIHFRCPDPLARQLRQSRTLRAPLAGLPERLSTSPQR